MSENIPKESTISSDEINLRELFATIWHHKWFIVLFTFFVTLIVVVVVYRMPKYYQTTTVIEVKPKLDVEGSSTSASPKLGAMGGAMGGAAALLGISGLGGGGDTEKHAAKMMLYRTNKHILDTVHYNTQYFASERFRPVELPEDNCSIQITDLHISDYKHFGIKITFAPVSERTFKLSAPLFLPFIHTTLGTFHYDTPIHTKYFSCTIHKRPQGKIPSTLILNGDKHFIFNEIISKNLTAEVGSGEKKSKSDTILPFVRISYLDTIPERGKQYVGNLLKKYIQQSIGDELEDIDTQLTAVNKQLKQMHQMNKLSAQQYQALRASSEETILPPEISAASLAQTKTKIDANIRTVQQQIALAKKVKELSRKKGNLKKLAPLLVDLKDSTTVSLVNQLQNLQAKKILLLQEYTPLHPSVKKLDQQMRTIRSRIRTNIDSLNAALKEKLTLLKKEQKRFFAELKKYLQNEATLVSAASSSKLYQSLYTYLLQKRSTLKLKKAEALSRFRIIDPIYTNPKPAKPKKALIAVVGLITAFILAIFLVFFREFLRNGEAVK